MRIFETHGSGGVQRPNTPAPALGSSRPTHQLILKPKDSHDLEWWIKKAANWIVILVMVVLVGVIGLKVVDSMMTGRVATPVPSQTTP